MRILVSSDSHGNARNIMLAVEQQPKADAYIFLGDGVRDAQFLLSRSKPAYLLRGNCDGNVPYPIYEVLTLAGQTTLCTHGHYDQVKFGLDVLLYRAKEHGAALCLYGHTHTPLSAYEDDVYLFNPGSIRNGVYGFVDITAAGIVCQHVQIRDIF
jgi:putative phosphoesterase